MASSQVEGLRMSTPDYHSLYEKIGDMQATLRVVKHETQNTSTKLDSLALLVANQGHLAEDVTKLKTEVQQLQIEKFRREGAVGLIEWASKHWPFLLGIIAVCVWVAVANGLLK